MLPQHHPVRAGFADHARQNSDNAAYWRSISTAEGTVRRSTKGTAEWELSTVHHKNRTSVETQRCIPIELAGFVSVRVVI